MGVVQGVHRVFLDGEMECGDALNRNIRTIFSSREELGTTKAMLGFSPRSKDRFVATNRLVIISL